MRARSIIAAAAAASSLLTGAAATAHAQPTQLVVGFDDGAGSAQQARALRRAGFGSRAGTALHPFDARRITVSAHRAPRLLQILRHTPGVRYAELDVAVHATWIPNDPLLGQQWALDTVGARDAWDSTLGTGAVIAVVDTGVDSTHEDLAGMVDPGYDFVANDSDPRDEHGHGTHVSGIAAAIADNARGIAGIAPRAHIMPVRVLDSGGSGTMSNVSRGIVYAVDHGADVINLSLAGSSSTTMLRDAVNYAQSHGVLLACAAGNEGRTRLDYPAALSACTAVGATTSADTRASFSNRGTGLDLVAPGVGILSSVPGNRYESWSGTSMATPMVSGLAALLFARGLDRGHVLQTMQDTATDLGSRGYDTTYGYGRIDAAAALASTGGTPPPPPPDPTPDPTPPPPPLPTPNSTPTCTGASIDVTHGTWITIPLHCIDADGDTLTYSLLTRPSFGWLLSFSSTDGTARYYASYFSRGTTSFQFTASDGTDTAAPATITLVVT